MYPEDAYAQASKLSVCSGMGTAFLGYKAGDAFNWRMRHRTRQIRIDKVMSQPEAAGDFHLSAHTPRPRLVQDTGTVGLIAPTVIWRIGKPDWMQ